MKLQITERSADKKREVVKLRREGLIPAIIYRGGQEGQKITVDGANFNSLLRQVQPGRLSTQQFQLTTEDGKESKAILKEIQYHPTSYDVLHLDFEELKPDTQINVKIPIECVGVVDCVGVKLGGVVRQVIRHLRVRCLPKDIPNVFQLDIKDLRIGDSLRLSDLNIPETLRPLMNLNEVAVVIVKR